MDTYQIGIGLPNKIVIKVVLFDLDGTLLPLNQNEFIKDYFYLLTNFLDSLKLDSKRIMTAVGLGMDSMLNNQGLMTNEEIFDQTFIKVYGESYQSLEYEFNLFYETVFPKLQIHSSVNKAVLQTIDLLKEKDIKIILATNPIFPRIATYQRIKWAELEVEDFMHISTFENSKYTKPNLKYYLEILKLTNTSIEECIMVGNDVDDDMVVKDLNMKTYLITDCLINNSNQDIKNYLNGDFNDFYSYIKSLIKG